MQIREFTSSLRRSRTRSAISLSRHSGFTIIELMLSLVLLAIGAALSLPSYRAMIEKRQLTHGAEQLQAFVNAAQLEATKRNRVVTVSYSVTDDDDWCFGAVLGDTACDCKEAVSTEADYCAIDGAPSIMSSDLAGSNSFLTLVDGDGAYSYDPVRGIFNDLDDILTTQLSTESQTFQLEMTVGRTGQVNLCSPNSAHSVPGYKVCVADDEEA